MSRCSGTDKEWLAAVATGPVCRVARYSPAVRRAGGGALAVGKCENKIEEAGGDSLE